MNDSDIGYDMEWNSWMTRPELTSEKGWVIVRGKEVFEYQTWNEAVTVNQMLGGSLMSKTYYESQYTQIDK